jgi:hypothetical protein
MPAKPAIYSDFKLATRSDLKQPICAHGGLPSRDPTRADRGHGGGSRRGLINVPGSQIT